MERKTLIATISVFPAACLLLGLMLEGPAAAAVGLGRIIVSPSILLHDYLAVGGLAATLVNAGLCGLICCMMIMLLKIELNGPFIAAVYTVIGFAFFGKNILNIWPIFIGVKLYAMVQQVPFKNFALVAFFGTTLGPLFSAVAFGNWMNGSAALATAVLFGVSAGFVLPPLASHMLRFHDGYNIYNIGFTGGIIGSFLTALLRSFDFSVTAATDLSGDYHRFFFYLFLISFSAMILSGLYGDFRRKRRMIRSLRKIYASSGRLVSDFVRIGDIPSTLVNMGIMGYISSVFVLLLGGAFNGPVIGGILTVVGFAAFGKHPRNTLPVLAGVYIASLLKVWSGGSTGVIIAGLFGTTLAPIAGQYGILAGVAAGFFHLSIVMNVGVLHGGVNLYNNGFAGGFVASFLVPVFDAFKRNKES